MTLTGRFVELMRRDPSEVPLDEAALLIAMHADPELDEARVLRRLDDLAQACHPPTLDGLLRLLFVDEGFTGNRADYFDPRNSLLHEVLDRRTGIPITLSVVALEVGRRAGVPLVGVGLPGHFLVRDQVDQELFIDVFDRGQMLRERQVRDLFNAMQPGAEFHQEYLRPVNNLAIVARMLGNLRAVYLQRADNAALTWVLRLLTCLPDAPAAVRRELAANLEGLGRFSEAAEALEDLAGDATAEASNDERRALYLRSRLN